MWDVETSFQIYVHQTTKFLGFSQRKFYGFRNNLEFDHKSILIAN